jgi:hypothetical protein
MSSVGFDDADRGQRLHRHRRDLGIRIRRVHADQLDARLRQLPRGGELGALHPQHLAGI